jgi:chromosome segregation protein
MLLTSLEIYGFKSFANREKFVFDQGITGIVGPNGCGKSNVVDAIRWVLGEQKTRNLRSDKMENVIFNGTQKRRKANFAEVSLSFENTKNILPTEYSTVTITRKLFRSGESEYQINGVTCRLKDIQNLFMDTGVGSDSYAIIELKMVDEILTNRDNERRKFFEEAAGISKYKVRKKQTLRKLKATDDDLERVEDLLFEIEKNLKALEKQARRTQRYFELKDQYKQISSQYAYLKMQDIQEQRHQLERDAHFLSDQLSATQAEMAQREARLQQLKKELLDNEKNLSEAQYDLNKHLSRIQSVETQRSVKNERLKYLQQREQAILNQMETERQQLKGNEEQVGELLVKKEKLNQELRNQQEKEAKLKEEAAQLSKLNEEQQTLTQSTAAQHRATEQEVQRLRQEIEIKGVQMRSLESELERAEEDKSQRREDMGAFSEKAEQLKAEISTLEKQAQELEVKQKAHEEDLAETEELINELKDHVYKKNRVLDAKQNEYNLTKSLVENLEGFPESVKFLKKNAQWIKDAPLLSDVFACPEEYKVAFENYLEPFLSYYIVPSREDGMLSVHLLTKSAKGRANFFILDELEDFRSGTPLLFTQARPALELVDFAPEYRKLAAFLFSHVYMVESEGDIPEDLPEGTVFLTRSGHVARRRFMLGGGSLGLFQGKRLGRAKNLERLNKELKKLNKELTAQKLKLDQALEKQAQLRKIDFRKELEPCKRQLLERQKDLSVLELREKEHREFLTRVGRRTEELVEKLNKLQEAVEKAVPQLRVQQEELQMLTSRLAQHRQLAQERAEALSESSSRYNEANIQLIHLQNQESNLSREISQKRERIQHFHENSRRLKEEYQETKKNIEELVSSNHQDDDVIMGLYEQKKQQEGRVDRLEQMVANTKNSITQVDESMSGQRKKREDLLEQQRNLQEQATEIKIQLSSLAERMSVEFQVEVESLSEEALFDKPLDNYDLESLEAKLHKLRHRVQSFGDINPMAVEAFNEMKERHEFILEQKQDLLDAKATLLNTIQEIDDTAREKFLETFQQVRTHFQRVYQGLFTEDSQGDLILKDPENPLESDIGIVAKPKGKRPQTISQLSGGEKTLTAVALLFSIYLIKPAPFCIFDEVDAPLDDANIDKFNNIIKEFSRESQFIIVTHNKRTMASTQIIYGVTMEDRGISKPVPIDLETILKQGDGQKGAA